MRTILASLLFLTIACTASAQTFPIAGTMRHTTIEGGCWYLETSDSSQRYELFGDPELINPLHTEGLTTRLSVTRMKGAASICMVGDIVKVVERLDTKRNAHDPNFQSVDLNGTIHRTKAGTWYLKTDRARYEFQKAPEKKYRRINAPFHRKVTIVLGRKSTKENMDGVIMPEKPEKKRGALRKIENHDPR